MLLCDVLCVAVLCCCVVMLCCDVVLCSECSWECLFFKTIIGDLLIVFYSHLSITSNRPFGLISQGVEVMMRYDV